MIADNANRRPNERLRYQRRLRGWTLDDVAEGLHRLAEQTGGSELGVDAHMVGRWERGVRRPAARYVALLCKLFETRADELDLVSDAPPIETKEDTVRRRQFLQYLAVMSGATVLDWDRVSMLVSGGPGGAADGHLLDDLHGLTRSYARKVETEAPRSLLPALRSHVALLGGALEAPQPDGIRRRLLSMAGETAALAGWLSHLLENRGDASFWWAYARRLAADAGDSALTAFVLVLNRSQHSTASYGGRFGDSRHAMALLDEAASHLTATAPAHIRAFMHAARAEDHAASGDAAASQRDLDLADGALASAAERHDGFFVRWDSSRLAGYRGSCALALRRPQEATTVLEDALSRTSAAMMGQHCAVMTDLAAAYADQREVEHACDLLLQSLSAASQAGLGEIVQRVGGARLHLEEWRATPAVRELDEEMTAVALA